MNIDIHLNVLICSPRIVSLKNILSQKLVFFRQYSLYIRDITPRIPVRKVNRNCQSCSSAYMEDNWLWMAY